jgi:hypothetical protein
VNPQPQNPQSPLTPQTQVSITTTAPAEALPSSVNGNASNSLVHKMNQSSFPVLSSTLTSVSAPSSTSLPLSKPLDSKETASASKMSFSKEENAASSYQMQNHHQHNTATASSYRDMNLLHASSMTHPKQHFRFKIDNRSTSLKILPPFPSNISDV